MFFEFLNVDVVSGANRVILVNRRVRLPDGHDPLFRHLTHDHRSLSHHFVRRASLLSARFLVVRVERFVVGLEAVGPLEVHRQVRRHEFTRLRLQDYNVIQK